MDSLVRDHLFIIRIVSAQSHTLLQYLCHLYKQRFEKRLICNGSDADLPALRLNDLLYLRRNISDPSGLSVQFYKPSSDIQTACIHSVAPTKYRQIAGPPARYLY